MRRNWHFLAQEKQGNGAWKQSNDEQNEQVNNGEYITDYAWVKHGWQSEASWVVAKRIEGKPKELEAIASRNSI